MKHVKCGLTEGYISDVSLHGYNHLESILAEEMHSL